MRRITLLFLLLLAPLAVATLTLVQGEPTAQACETGVTGHVRDGYTGMGIPGIKVEIYVDGLLYSTAKTNSNGRYSACVPNYSTVYAKLCDRYRSGTTTRGYINLGTFKIYQRCWEDPGVDPHIVFPGDCPRPPCPTP